MANAREPSMEDILASIKRVIAEEKEIRAAAPPPLPATDGEEAQVADDEDILELDDAIEEGAAETSAAMPEVPFAPVDLGPPLVEERTADESRASLEQLASVAAIPPPPTPSANPLEDVIRDMLRPILKQWLDDNLPQIVDEHVKREISRITGKPL